MVQNIFKVGPQVSGESFFGRKKELETISNDLYSGSNIHLVGVPRIGKSSLANSVLDRNREMPGYLQVQLCMGEYHSAFQFWFALWDDIREALKKDGSWDNSFQESYAILDTLVEETGNWYIRMHRPLQSVLKEIKSHDRQLILTIDEFDAVTEVFGRETAYYQLLRSIFSDSQYATNGILISRQSLSVLEHKVTTLSSFQGVFPPSGRLTEFNSDDMNEFYAALGKYGITLTDDGMSRLEYYTGNIPYLCCMFARQMVKDCNGRCLDEAQIDVFRKVLAESILNYYEDLVERLRADQHLDPLLSLIYARGRPIDNKCRREMEAMGTLHEDAEGNYYAYSQDFTTYLGLTPLNLPVWDMIISTERKLKELVRKVYPELGEDNHRDRAKQEQIVQKYPELKKINWEKVDHNLGNILLYKKQTSTLDGLSLGFIVDMVTSNWAERFGNYFSHDSGWKNRLLLIKKVRNPLFHGQTVLNEEELAACNQYCGELLALKF